MRRNTVLLALVAAVVAILAYAWIDGGREPLHQIVEPVAVPGAMQ
jgi:hypothetical protein